MADGERRGYRQLAYGCGPSAGDVFDGGECGSGEGPLLAACAHLIAGPKGVNLQQNLAADRAEAKAVQTLRDEGWLK